MSGKSIDASVAELSADWQHDPNYYDNADSWVNVFWDRNTVFRRQFDRMDHSEILEIACGRGRHTWVMREWENRKTMTDLVANNIAFCKSRFASYPDVMVVECNGKDLSFASDESYTSVFCYDAMVHFDHTIVKAYLLEIDRVLKPGGMALLHHSNYPGNPGGDYKRNPHWRAFMPDGLFADYCAKAGLELIEQVIIPWGDVISSDRVSLVKKPV